MVFNRYYRDTDKAVGKQVRLMHLLAPVLFIFMGLMLNDGHYIVLSYFGLASILWLVFYPGYHHGRFEKKLRKEINKSENAIWLGKRDMEFDDERVRVVFDKGEETVQWSAFIKSAHTDTHFFLFLTPRQALLVPKRAMTETQVDELTQLLNNKIKK